jgi:transcription elongation factor GreA
VLTASQWSSWWKDAKAALEQDDRVDLSQAFRQTYRLRSSSDEGGIALPTLEPRRGVRPNLNLIRRFLEQHPDETARAARTYSTILRRWARAERTNAEERLAVQLQIHRWQKKVDEEFVEALAGILEAKTEASVFSDMDDQKLITEVGLSQEQLWKETVCFALSSRYAEIRDLALERLGRDPKVGRALLSELIREPAERPVAALAAMTLATPRGGAVEPFAPDLWEAGIAAAALAEGNIREPLRKQALSLLGPNTTLVEQLLKTPPSDTQLDQIAMLVRRWRSSERFLQPLLNILRRAGHEELVKELRAQRMAKTNQMLLSQAEQDHLELVGHFMSRATFERLKSEIERLNYELKTTVAQAIAKARALGDLSENAEYDAARMKQRDFSERLHSMARRLREAKIIDELSLPVGRAYPGTEVELEDLTNGRMRTFWILGEGDDVLGPEVISYTAPLGHALIGRHVGDQIRLPGEGTVHEYALRRITPRLPAAVVTSAGSVEEVLGALPLAEDEAPEAGGPQSPVS